MPPAPSAILLCQEDMDPHLGHPIRFLPTDDSFHLGLWCDRCTCWLGAATAPQPRPSPQPQSEPTTSAALLFSYLSGAR